MNRIDRLTGIIFALQHRQQTASQLAERFAVSRRTILRDIDSLCQIGIPIIAVSGTGGGYSLAESHWLKPIQLTESEATALLLAAQTMTTHSSAPFAAATQSAVDKLRTALNPTTLAQADRDLSAFDVTAPRRVTFLDPFETIRAALKNDSWIQIDYQSLNRRSTHLLMPRSLTSTDGFWYLSAVSASARAERRFRVDRIVTIAPADPPPDHESIVRAALNEPRPYDHPDHPEITATLTYRGARLAEDLPHGAERIEPIGDDQWAMRFRCPPAELDYWARTFFGFGPDAKVSAPAELVEKIRRLLDATAENYRTVPDW